MPPTVTVVRPGSRTPPSTATGGPARRSPAAPSRAVPPSTSGLSPSAGMSSVRRHIDAMGTPTRRSSSVGVGGASPIRVPAAKANQSSPPPSRQQGASSSSSRIGAPAPVRGTSPRLGGVGGGVGPTHSAAQRGATSVPKGSAGGMPIGARGVITRSTGGGPPSRTVSPAASASLLPQRRVASPVGVSGATAARRSVATSPSPAPAGGGLRRAASPSTNGASVARRPISPAATSAKAGGAGSHTPRGTPKPEGASAAAVVVRRPVTEAATRRAAMAAGATLAGVNGPRTMVVGQAAPARPPGSRVASPVSGRLGASTASPTAAASRTRSPLTGGAASASARPGAASAAKGAASATSRPTSSRRVPSPNSASQSHRPGAASPPAARMGASASAGAYGAMGPPQRDPSTRGMSPLQSAAARARSPYGRDAPSSAVPTRRVPSPLGTARSAAGASRTVSPIGAGRTAASAGVGAAASASASGSGSGLAARRATTSPINRGGPMGVSTAAAPQRDLPRRTTSPLTGAQQRPAATASAARRIPSPPTVGRAAVVSPKGPPQSARTLVAFSPMVSSTSTPYSRGGTLLYSRNATGTGAGGPPQSNAVRPNVTRAASPRAVATTVPSAAVANARAQQKSQSPTRGPKGREGSPSLSPVRPAAEAYRSPPRSGAAAHFAAGNRSLPSASSSSPRRDGDDFLTGKGGFTPLRGQSEAGAHNHSNNNSNSGLSNTTLHRGGVEANGSIRIDDLSAIDRSRLTAHHNHSVEHSVGSPNLRGSGSTAAPTSPPPPDQPTARRAAAAAPHHNTGNNAHHTSSASILSGGAILTDSPRRSASTADGGGGAVPPPNATISKATVPNYSARPPTPLDTRSVSPSRAQQWLDQFEQRLRTEKLPYKRWLGLSSADKEACFDRWGMSQLQRKIILDV